MRLKRRIVDWRPPVFFMRRPQAAATRAFLSRFKTEAVTQPIVDLGGEMYRQWHPSHGMDVNAALLAATTAPHGWKDLHEEPEALSHAGCGRGESVVISSTGNVGSTLPGGQVLNR